MTADRNPWHDAEWAARREMEADDLAPRRRDLTLPVQRWNDNDYEPGDEQ